MATNSKAVKSDKAFEPINRYFLSKDLQKLQKNIIKSMAQSNDLAEYFLGWSKTLTAEQKKGPKAKELENAISALLKVSNILGSAADATKNVKIPFRTEPAAPKEKKAKAAKKAAVKETSAKSKVNWEALKKPQAKKNKKPAAKKAQKPGEGVRLIDSRPLDLSKTEPITPEFIEKVKQGLNAKKVG